MSLRLNGVDAGYRRRLVFRNLTLPEIPRGTLVAVIGPNAVGKSTLLKSLAGVQPASGSMMLHEEPLAQGGVDQRVRQVGYLPQTLPQPVPLIAYEIVFSACRSARPDWSRAHIERAIEATFKTLGIHKLALRRLDEMSGGQRQMVGLAQVLVRRTPLLLLDEPTSALDLHWQLNVLNAVRAASDRDGAIALVASHDLNLSLRFCDQVLVLTPDGGAELGRPEAVLTKAMLARTYGIEARVERCSHGYPIVLADNAVTASDYF